MGRRAPGTSRWRCLTGHAGKVPSCSRHRAPFAGTAIETSLTGLVEITLHKADELVGTPIEGLDFPLHRG
jgi:hypothetical protein